MKTVGILTFQWASNRNFGASLQAYAHKTLINKILKNKNTQIINFNPTTITLKGKILIYFTAKNFKKYNKKFLNFN